MICPWCPAKPGVAVYKYSMEEHWRVGHSEKTVTSDIMKASVAISANEQKWLKARWSKATKAAAKKK